MNQTPPKNTKLLITGLDWTLLEWWKTSKLNLKTIKDIQKQWVDIILCRWKEVKTIPEIFNSLRILEQWRTISSIIKEFWNNISQIIVAWSEIDDLKTIQEVVNLTTWTKTKVWIIVIWKKIEQEVDKLPTNIHLFCTPKPQNWHMAVWEALK